MLKLRLIFGPLMILVLAGVFWLDSSLDQVDLAGTVWSRLFNGRPYLPAGLVMLGVWIALVILGSRELVAIFRAKGIETHGWIIAASAVSGLVMVYAVPSSTTSQNTLATVGTLLAVLFVVTMIHHSWIPRRTQGAVAVCGATMLTFIYLGLLPGFYIAIRRWHSAWVVAAVLLVVKSSDIGAYFTGRAMGKHKLIPWLSPGKTWEGLIGGAVFSALVAAGLAALLNHLGVTGVYHKDHATQMRVFQQFDFPLVWSAVAGAAMALIGQFGDLTASLFKRDAGIKDSGSAIPGFGGLLDVLDSPIVVAPVAYWLLRAAAEMGEG